MTTATAVKHAVTLFDTVGRQLPEGSCSCGQVCVHLAAPLLVKGRSVVHRSTDGALLVARRVSAEKVMCGFAIRLDEFARGENARERSRRLWELFVFNYDLGTEPTGSNISSAKWLLRLPIAENSAAVEDWPTLAREKTTSPDTRLRSTHGFCSTWKYLEYVL